MSFYFKLKLENIKTTIIISLLSLSAFGAFAQSGSVNTNNTVCKVAPRMPSNAVRVWPAETYIPTENKACPPCYEYKRRSGLTVMECPFLLPVAPGSTSATTVKMQEQNTYTGNYPSCKRNADMPANAKYAWPTAHYIPTGNAACAPCYEYKTKHGLKVMECPDALFPPANKE
jgi:hypothetical protein